MEYKILVALISAELGYDIRDEKGNTLWRKGDAVLILPKTAARGVFFNDGQNLETAWNSLFAAIAANQSTLASESDRLARLEIWAAQNGYK